MDYSRLIEGYDKMVGRVAPFSYCFLDSCLLYDCFVSFPFFWNDELLILLQTPAERVKAKMKLQLAETGDHSFSYYELGC
jgi:hypothetical protein